MHIQITGKHIELSDALRERIVTGLEDAVSKYAGLDGEATAIVSKQAHEFEVDFSVHLSSGVTLQAHGQGGDAYMAVVDTLNKIEKRMRRYKRRLKNHRQRDPIRSETIAEHIIRSGQDDSEPDQNRESDAASAIIAESAASLKTMTVSMAVMQLELTEGPALMFRNAAHGGLNMVYVRSDGHIGWVDPAGAGSTQSGAPGPSSLDDRSR